MTELITHNIDELGALIENFGFREPYLLAGHLVSIGFAGSAVISRAEQ